MARRGRRKKFKFKHSFELWAVIFILMSTLGIGIGSPVGLLGRVAKAIAVFFFGSWNLLFMLLFLALGIYMIFKKAMPFLWDKKLIGIYLFIIGVLILSHLSFIKNDYSFSVVLNNSFNTTQSVASKIIRNHDYNLVGGGLIGAFLAGGINALVDYSATKAIAIVIIVIGLSVLTGVSILELLRSGFYKGKELLVKDSEENEKPLKVTKEKEEEEKDKAKKEAISSYAELEAITSVKEEKDALQASREVELVGGEKDSSDKANYIYQLPPLGLLNDPENKNKNVINVEGYSRILENVLNDFGITGKVVDYHIGPSVTQYELEIKGGTRLSKIVSINKEISLALAKKDVRIQAPIPGKSTVGIEVANDKISPVSLKEILVDEPGDARTKKLFVALGKNIMGESRFTEIDKTPHLLVAGATGSGKSVCINSIIASILMRSKPDEVKLVMVDPKKVELSMYNGIPHLLMPVVTDPRKANVALQRIVQEMENRYVLFSDKNVKNISGYNELIEKENKKRSGEDKVDKMYYIVVIVDELADLMLVASREVEDSIMRITQMARAAGIHLIVATQRPSTDVITGLVKSNIPSRISFAVSSSIDSRTILDMGGAEKLLGKGDMLYFPMGASTPERVQGAFVSDEELQRIVNHTVSQQKAKYDENFMNLSIAADQGNAGGAVGGVDEEYDDPLYNEIVDFVISSQKASASALQRRFKVGYNRAARVIDLLEERGIVGPPNGSKPREVLVKEDDN